MASIQQETRNEEIRYRVQFYDLQKRRKSIRLGAVGKDTAETVKRHVEHLLRCAKRNHPPSEQTDKWLSILLADPSWNWLYDRMAAAGLVAEREKPKRERTTLGQFLKDYIAGRAKLKPNTKRNYEVTRQHLLSHFGADRPLKNIAPGDADDWREGLIRKGLSSATISREVKRARQFFRAAIRRHLLTDNPFRDLPAPKQVNKDREFFVTRDVIVRVLEACPDVEWRLIVALSRYGGLRCPSEHLSLQWPDVNWELDRMTIRSPKTEHHPDGATRIIPIFPELRPYLEDAWELAKRGTRHVITRYRDGNTNMRTQFERIIRRAGLETWPRLFQNLRASRETELTAEYPAHVACAWIGNSEAVARDHYLQLTDEHFRQAVCGGGAKVVPKSVPNEEAPSRTDSQETKKPSGVTTQTACFPIFPMVTETELAPPRGVEPLSLD